MKTAVRNTILIFGLMMFNLIGHSQPPPNPGGGNGNPPVDPGPVPIGGVEILLLAGGAMGVRKMLRRK